MQALFPQRIFCLTGHSQDTQGHQSLSDYSAVSRDDRALLRFQWPTDAVSQKERVGATVLQPQRLSETEPLVG